MPFPQKLSAIVLRSVNYGDFDRMLTLFTRERGLVSAMARGAHKPSSRLNAPSTPFCAGEYVLTERGGSYLLTGSTIDRPHYALRESPETLSCAALFARLCLDSVQPELPNEGLFILLLQALAYLENGIGREEDGLYALTTGFLLRYLALVGQQLVLDRCVVCQGRLKDARFDFDHGGLACAAHAAPGMPVATKEQVLLLLRGGEGERLVPIDGGKVLYSVLRRYTEMFFGHSIGAFDYFESLLIADA